LEASKSDIRKRIDSVKHSMKYGAVTKYDEYMMKLDMLEMLLEVSEQLTISSMYLKRK
jgi:hypothetical protein